MLKALFTNQKTKIEFSFLPVERYGEHLQAMIDSEAFDRIFTAESLKDVRETDEGLVVPILVYCYKPSEVVTPRKLQPMDRPWYYGKFYGIQYDTRTYTVMEMPVEEILYGNRVYLALDGTENIEKVLKRKSLAPDIFLSSYCSNIDFDNIDKDKFRIISGEVNSQKDLYYRDPAVERNVILFNTEEETWYKYGTGTGMALCLKYMIRNQMFDTVVTNELVTIDDKEYYKALKLGDLHNDEDLTMNKLFKIDFRSYGYYTCLVERHSFKGIYFVQGLATYQEVIDTYKELESEGVNARTMARYLQYLDGAHCIGTDVIRIERIIGKNRIMNFPVYVPENLEDLIRKIEREKYADQYLRYIYEEAVYTVS